MVLNLHRVLRYEHDKPVAGAVIASFRGNQKKCVSSAKKWLKDHPQPIDPIYVWKE